MSERHIIPILPPSEGMRPAGLPMPAGAGPVDGLGDVRDRLQRPLRDLRISVTDRCNFRCSYCMPREVFGQDYPYLPQSELLSFEEITRAARLFIGLGVRKLRLTGGEPLLRRHLDRLVSMLADLRTPDGQPLDLTLTTNGALLARTAARLKAAGLQRITVSLDALDDAVFRRMNDADFPVADVLAGIQAALDAGLERVKVNMVVQRGTNDHEVLPMARHFRERFGPRVSLRFIEYMDVGASNGWRMDEVVPSAELLALLQGHFPMEAVRDDVPEGETARRWRYLDGRGEVGFISSVTEAFCGDCNRARLSTEGQLYLCLFAGQGHDLRQLLRADPPLSDEHLLQAVAAVWQGRQDRYSQRRHEQTPGGSTPRRRVEMSYIGG
ncbi:cyclic pyranopterin phosphate synthase [Sphaerotilus hippei]|uniref:GTP 3',8-cyclase n=1 Tax=Sphaerotilus hippei TaxID=744406 RepID=A0A318HBQ8_9BURK|nr:GTP 3',8-cyclase MoaA [Sphaerotilus hippei]PXW98169.1 cyclic pyranopterin phosphate synthase [Sphaerotilus hippei]